MAERQSSSQNVNSTSNDMRNQNSSKSQHSSQNSSQFKTQHQISRESQRFEVSNTSSESHRQPAQEVIFCKYNPLHVVHITRQRDHELSECPDREWGPGEEIIKYNDLEEDGDNQ
ncbi:hypothetical protein CAEBREN_04588 [Caenorhabditis brenneri]|uniref:Uncharacterized protein n=1 Tax=Caenorhabditis brenneri TaxID=135651 RepID=G0NZV1_CAEBE|nr:hypothetical protein CAEBREN_04588 [Caenorhabditis brenneri]